MSSIKRKYSFLCRLKINLGTRNGTCVNSWLNDMFGCEQEGGLEVELV
jgi:hypothetical protein